MCEGDQYMMRRFNISQRPVFMMFRYPGGASDGCDSILVLTLTIDPFETKEIKDTICAGEVYTYNGIDYTVAGNYPLDTIPAAVGL